MTDLPQKVQPSSLAQTGESPLGKKKLQNNITLPDLQKAPDQSHAPEKNTGLTPFSQSAGVSSRYYSIPHRKNIHLQQQLNAIEVSNAEASLKSYQNIPSKTHTPLLQPANPHFGHKRSQIGNELALVTAPSRARLRSSEPALAGSAPIASRFLGLTSLLKRLRAAEPDQPRRSQPLSDDQGRPAEEKHSAAQRGHSSPGAQPAHPADKLL